MFRQKQISFRNLEPKRNAFGGDTLVDCRKTARPISTKKPMHIVIRSDRLIFLKHLKAHRHLLLSAAKKQNIKIYDFVFNGNNLHLVARFYSRNQYRNFIRVLTGGFALITKMRKVFPFRPFTRIAEWGKVLKKLLRYIHLNALEADGVRRDHGRALISEWYDWGPAPNVQNRIGLI